MKTLGRLHSRGLGSLSPARVDLVIASITSIASLALLGCAVDASGEAVDPSAPGDEAGAIEVAEQPFRAGLFTMIAQHSGKCLDITGASRADGARLIQWNCNGQSNQRFQAVDLGGGEFALISQNSGKCLDVAGASMSDRAPLIQYTCHFGDNQRFIVVGLTDGYTFVMAKHSYKCLDVSGASQAPGAPVIQFACHIGPNQRFKFL